MRKVLFLAVVLLGAAAVSRAEARSLESLRAQSDNLSADFSQMQRLRMPPVSAMFIRGGREDVPGYSDLPTLLDTAPRYTTPEGVKVWSFTQLGTYRSEADATAVMNYWQTALSQSGLRVTTGTVSELGGYYDYNIAYEGDQYVEVYEAGQTWPSRDAAEKEMAVQAAALRQSGLVTVKALPARLQGQFTFLIYYLVAYDADASNRLRVCRYHPDTLLASEAAALEAAARDKAAFAKAGVPVLSTSLMSGPNGTIYILAFIGKDKQLATVSQGDIKGEAAAKQAMADAIKAIAQDKNVVLDAEVSRSGPWFEEMYSFQVRYLKVN